METNKTTIESINKMNKEELTLYIIRFKDAKFEAQPHYSKAIYRAKEIMNIDNFGDMMSLVHK